MHVIPCSSSLLAPKANKLRGFCLNHVASEVGRSHYRSDLFPDCIFLPIAQLLLCIYIDIILTYMLCFSYLGEDSWVLQLQVKTCPVGR